jgi:hypothetical protein
MLVSSTTKRRIALGQPTERHTLGYHGSLKMVLGVSIDMKVLAKQRVIRPYVNAMRGSV